jgi:hypothetical protein
MKPPDFDFFIDVEGRGWQCASNVKQPSGAATIRSVNPENRSCIAALHRTGPSVELINVLWQRQIVEQLFVLDDPGAANKNINATGDEQDQPAPKAARRFPHDPRQGQDEQPETDSANPSAHHDRP